MLRLGRAFLCHPFAVLLCVNARATRKYDGRSGKRFEKIARSLPVNTLIKIDTAAPRARALPCPPLQRGKICRKVSPRSPQKPSILPLPSPHPEKVVPDRKSVV